MTDYLRRWKDSHGQECLLVKGARQVGKTYTINRFGAECYESFVEINFVKSPLLAEAFAGELSAADIKRRLSLLIPGVSFPEGRTLLFIDEIQESAAARAALKFLALDPTIDVVASGSLLGIGYKQAALASVPVGYERQVEMFGLDFEEYLWAKGYGNDALTSLASYAERLEAVPMAVHERMLGMLREYMAVGGMPAVVQRFVDTDNFSEAFETQKMILDSYRDDIARYAPANIRAKARACYSSVPRQLAKENTKFQYGVVEKKGTARKFDTSVDWLEEASVVWRCRHVSTPTFPLSAYEQDDRFRIYLSDMGLLTCMHGFEMMDAVVNDKLVGPMKGGYYENLIADMLAKSGKRLRYWKSDRGDQEIEFLLEADAAVVPVEVKAKRGATASLNNMLERGDVKVGYKLGACNVGVTGKKITLPLYLAPSLCR